MEDQEDTPGLPGEHDHVPYSVPQVVIHEDLLWIQPKRSQQQAEDIGTVVLIYFHSLMICRPIMTWKIRKTRLAYQVSMTMFHILFHK